MLSIVITNTCLLKVNNMSIKVFANVDELRDEILFMLDTFIQESNMSNDEVSDMLSDIVSDINELNPV